MISAVITTFGDALDLTATLSALAPAAMDGFVREVLVRPRGASAAVVEAALEAGATILDDPALAVARAAARQPWLLILVAGSRPQVGWEDRARVHLRAHPDQAAWFELALAATGARARLTEAGASFRGRVLARPSEAQGLLISKSLLDEIGGGDADHAAILRGLGRGRLRPLGARVLRR